MALGTTSGHLHFEHRGAMKHSTKNGHQRLNSIEDEGSAQVPEHVSLLFAMQSAFREKLAVKMNAKKAVESRRKTQKNTLTDISEKSRKIVQDYNQENKMKRPRESSWSGTSNRMKKLPPILPNESKSAGSNNISSEKQGNDLLRKKQVANFSKHSPLNNNRFGYDQSPPQRRTYVIGADNGDKGKIKVPSYNRKEHSKSDSNFDDDCPPPNMARLRLVSNRKKKELMKTIAKPDPVFTEHIYAEHPDQSLSSQPLTDFQKWQLEQDESKRKRLERFRENNKPDANLLDTSITEIDCESFNSRKKSVPLSRHQTKNNKNIKKDKQKRAVLAGLSKANHHVQSNETLHSDDEQIFFNKTFSKGSGMSEELRTAQNHYKLQRIFSDEPEPVLASFHKPVLVRHDGRSTANSRNSTRNSFHPAHRALPTDHSEVFSETSNFVKQSSSDQDPPEYENIRLVPCNICGRKFKSDRLSKHATVCAKTSSKKRKVFNMSQIRRRGTDMETFAIVKGRTYDEDHSRHPHKNNWRHKHEDFIKTIRHAKMLSSYVAKGGNISDLPPPEPSLNPDYITCNYCKRRFAPKVAERHIPRCKDVKSRPPPPKSKTNQRKYK